MDANLIEALQWERDHGYLSPAEFTRLTQEGAPPAHVVVLQEATEPKPPRAPDGIERLSTGLDLSPYARFKSQALPSRTPAVSATAGRALSEVQLQEARAMLYHSAEGVQEHKALPEGIHARLAAAVRG